MSFLDEIADELSALTFDSRELRKLGLTFLLVLGLVGGLLVWKGRLAGPYLLGGAALFGLWGLIWPSGLGPIFRLWMSLAIVLGFIVSRLLLTALFFLVITPIGLVLKLSGKDLLDMRIGDRDSYWHVRPHEPYHPKRSEKMY